MAEITDPGILNQFNAQPSAPSGLVTDPEILKHFGVSPPVSTTEDVLKSGGTGLLKGAVGGMGSMGDVRNMASKGVDYLGGKFGVSPEAMQTVKDTASKAALISPFTSAIANAPSSSDISHFVGGDDAGRNIVGQALDRNPQTTPGKYAETTGEFLGNPTTYIGPGGIGAKVLTATGAALGSEAAGQYAKDSKYEPLIRAIGGVAGGHGVTVVPRITPMISADRQAATALLDRERVPLTAGDRTGNTNLKAAESELSPGGNEAQNRAFQQAAFNRVGEQIGERPIKGQTGAVNTMMQRIGRQFDGLVARNNVSRDPQLVNDLQDVRSTYNDTPGLYPQETVNSVNASIDRINNVFNHGAGAPITGAEYQTLRSNMRRAAQGATDPQRAEGLHDVVNALDDAMERTIQRVNPADAGAWAQARRNYQNGLVLERWAGSTNMTPATLAQAAKAVYGKRQYVRGLDGLSDLADAGSNVLKQYQDSGTARRLQIEGITKALGGIAGYALGTHSGMSEGGVGGLLLGENAFPFIARPAARAGLMNPITQGALSNQLLPYRFETSPSTIALMNQIRGGDQSAPPQVPGARKAKDGKWYLPDPARPGKYLEARP